MSSNIIAMVLHVNEQHFFDSFWVNQVLKLKRNALICSWFKTKLHCALKNFCLPVVSLMLKRFCGVDCFQISGKVAMLKKTLA